MKIRISTKEPKWGTFVAFAFEGEELRGYPEKLDRKFKLKKAKENEGFKGKEDEVLEVIAGERKVVLIGLGRKEEFEAEKLRRAIAKLKSRGKVAIALPDGKDTVRAAVEGLRLGLYRFRKYKREDEERKPEEVFLLRSGSPFKKIEKAQAELKFAEIVAEAVNFARDIGNEPGNIINPSTLAEIAGKLAEEEGLECEIIDEPALRKLGMEGILSVGAGSEKPPKLVHIVYKPEKPKEKIAVIGKGITFDTGGLNLKTFQHMRHMKLDKAGACAVLGIMKAVSKLKLKVEVHGIFPACENIPSGKAQRPDDVIRMADGKTVEIVNTDAEGRLTLADTIVYAKKLGVTRIIDLATLTGACVIALGEFTAGVMGNDDEFVEKILEAGKKAGEKLWQLPLDLQLEEKLKSEVADLKNVGDGGGGAITGALFMKKFVGETKWVHIDIAGPAFTDKGWGYNPKGATGFGVRTLLEYIISL